MEKPNAMLKKESIVSGQPVGNSRQSLAKWLRQREIGNQSRPVDNEYLSAEAYLSVQPVVRWNAYDRTNHPGAIFNLEYNKSGSLLAAACEHNSVQFFDPISHRFAYALETTHNKGVNGVKFLDDHMFATCSDDYTVALWDVRQLNTRIRVLNGHSNSVKNVEYSKKDNLLITSSFDGNIYTWDLNSYTENGLVYKRIFQSNGIMRLAISPDSSKLVISTTAGYLLIVHNMNLEDFSIDLEGFKPNMLRLMESCGSEIPNVSLFLYLFDKHRKKNRVEVIDDFPPNDPAEIVFSLQIHPEGWCVLSRNLASNHRTEWTCVHDIQDTEPYEPPTEKWLAEAERCRRRIASIMDGHHNDIWESFSLYQNVRFLRDNENSNPTDSHVLENAHQIVRFQSGLLAPSIDEMNSAFFGNGISEERVQPNEPNHSGSNEALNSDGDVVELRPGPSQSNDERRYSSRYFSPLCNKKSNAWKSVVRQPLPMKKQRLTHYVKEACVCRGFIKESSFSSDGRVICSPYKECVRLFAFDSSCTELSRLKVNPGAPQTLYNLGKVVGHTDIVLCSKFAPHGYSFASGCLGGNITLYQPIL